MGSLTGWLPSTLLVVRAIVGQSLFRGSNYQPQTQGSRPKLTEPAAFLPSMNIAMYRRTERGGRAA